MFTSKPSYGDMRLVRAALLIPITDPTKLPIRYCIGGETYRGIPAEWNPKSNRKIIDANIVERDYSAKIPGTGLTIRVECFEYKDFPVFEWTVYLTNNGVTDSPIVSDLCGMDHILPAGEHSLLYHNNGDFGLREGMETKEHCLDDGACFTTGSVGGRSCDRAWPYLRIVTGDMSYNICVGWPGDWTANATRTKDGIHFEAKQAVTNFYLKPDETVRSPRMLVMAMEGGSDRAINMWRRYYFDHLLPRTEGQPLQAPKFVFLFRNRGFEHTLATEENQIEALKTFIQRGEKPDIWWIDFGWHSLDNADKHPSGMWHTQPERWPNGLGPLGDFCKENGIEFLLWFEPEHVTLNTWYEGHPEKFLLRQLTPDEENPIYNTRAITNFGDPECREWITHVVKQQLIDGKVKIYRQDLNIDPQHYWKQNDLTPDRAGITENLCVQGLLRYWDDLLLDIPDLWYDNCACGGRRNDLEAMRRGVPLHATDYGYGEHPVKQTFQKGWFEWIPYFRSIAYNWDDEDGTYNWMTIPGSKPGRGDYDAYAAHCAFAPSTTFGADLEPTADEESFKTASGFRALLSTAMPYTINSDFFTLTPVRKSNEDYFVIQFNREDEDEGLIQVIRNTRCEEESVTVHPITFNPEKTYVFDAPETGETFEVSGAQIAESGLTFSIPKRSGRFYFYRAKE